MKMAVPESVIAERRAALEKRSIFTGDALFAAFIVALVVMLVGGLIYVIVFGAFKNFGGWLAAATVASLIYIKFWYVYNAKVEPEKLRKTIELNLQRLSNSAQPDRVDYYYVDESNGMALCLDDKSLHIMSDYTGETAVGTKGAPKMIPLKSISSVEAFISSPDTFTIFGHASLGQKSAVAEYNKNNKEFAKKNTGLFLTLNDIDYPNMFITMKFESAKKWEIALRQAVSGDLPINENPRFLA